MCCAGVPGFRAPRGSGKGHRRVADARSPITSSPGPFWEMASTVRLQETLRSSELLHVPAPRGCSGKEGGCPDGLALGFVWPRGLPAPRARNGTPAPPPRAPGCSAPQASTPLGAGLEVMEAASLLRHPHFLNKHEKPRVLVREMARPCDDTVSAWARTPLSTMNIGDPLFSLCWHSPRIRVQEVISAF